MNQIAARIEEIEEAKRQFEGACKSALAGVGSRLRTAREAKGIRQEEAAKWAGFGRTQLVNVEAGRSAINNYALIALCSLYGVSSDFVLGLKTE